MQKTISLEIKSDENSVAISAPKIDGTITNFELAVTINFLIEALQSQTNQTREQTVSDLDAFATITTTTKL